MVVWSEHETVTRFIEPSSALIQQSGLPATKIFNRKVRKEKPGRSLRKPVQLRTRRIRLSCPYLLRGRN
jgi:hypothetical protein